MKNSTIDPKLKPDGTKRFKVNPQIGEAKYSISHHNGRDTHPDGSRFYGISIFTRKRDHDAQVHKLLMDGYTETQSAT